ncbi:MAG: alpha/beta fold hydrolase [Acidimicrobiales bacterium]
MAFHPLNMSAYGADTQDAPVVLLHGFTQTSQCWGPLAVRLAENRPVIAIDLPGHGGSGTLRADLVQTASLVADQIEPAMVLGYSLGGRVALHLALSRPDVVQQLVLIGATGGIDNEEERFARRTADNALASRIESIGVSAFLDEWLSQPLFSSLTEIQACRAARKTNTSAGLSASLRLCGVGTQTPLWERLNELQMPVLILAGEYDQKFIALGQRLASGIGLNAEFRVIKRSGHSAHLENPDAVLTAIQGWSGA